MVFAGFADVHRPEPTIREQRAGDNHVVWSVPPQAVAGLADRASDWATSDLDAADAEE